MPVIARAFPSSFVRALRSVPERGVGVVLRRHPDIQAQTKSGCGLGQIERRPAPIFFKPASALLARIVQEPLPDVLPGRVPAVQANCIGGLDLHDTPAASAGDAQHVPLDFREMSLG
jgi:hypothetical protein